MTVKIYSTPWCPYCKMAKDFLREHNIKFEDINVQEKPEKIEEMAEVSGQRGVPVITINGRVILGFDPEALKSALKIK